MRPILKVILPFIIFVSLDIGEALIQAGYECEYAVLETVWKKRTKVEEGYFCDVEKGWRRSLR